MKCKVFPCLLVIFSLWTSLFAPFIFAQDSETKGLLFKISESVKTPETPEPKTLFKTENLSQTEAEAIFRRLPPMPVFEGKTAEFKMSAESLKPPRTGKIIPLKFPADEVQATPDLPKTVAENLKVVRFSPTGDNSLVTDLSVTFSQPMISVSSPTEASESVPVKLTPEVKGRWRWLGTNTLSFDAETRFSMATKFTVTILKGTKSELGGTLQKDISWSFTTPPPKIEKFAPSDEPEGILPELAIMAVKFNQEIDETEILPKIKVFADGKRMPIKSVTNEIDPSFAVYQQLGKELKSQHWLAFRTVELLPLNSNVKVVFEKDLPSAEGFLTSETEQSFTFKTLTPFKIAEIRCGYNKYFTKCEPSDDIDIRFSHSLFPETFDTSLVKIEPAIKDVKITANNATINIAGVKKPNTIYNITISGKATDLYKRKLGEDVTVTIKTKIEEPQFYTAADDFVTLDPNGKPEFPIYTRNHKSFKVRLYAVTADDYTSYRRLLRKFYNNRQTAPTADFGKLIFDKTIEVDAEIDDFSRTEIDLKKALPNKFGHALLIAEPTVKSKEYNYQNRPFVTWVQSTNIGIDAFIDYEKLVAFATDLKTAKPLSNAEISLNYDKYDVLNSATNENGIAEFDLIDAVGRGFLLVENGLDSAILPESQDYTETVTDWKKQNPYKTLRWFVFDDRKIYRPDETVSVKGYIRKTSNEKFSDIGEIGNEFQSVNYVLKDSRNIEIKKGTAKLNDFGAFDFKLHLPKNINLGSQRLQFETEKSFANDTNEFVHIFEVQEFRRPEFEVTAKVETNAPFFVGEKAEISTTAKYYSGGFLKDAETVWNVTSTPTNYTPPNRDDFTFGTFVPWWKYSSGNYNERTSEKFTGKTDEDGNHQIALDFVEVNPAKPYNVQAEAQIQDVNRQTFASSTSLLVHPSTIYVGIRTPKNFVKSGEKLKIETITTDLDGKAFADKTVSIIAELRDWQKVGDEWKEVLVDTQTCRIRSTENVASCEIIAKQGGIFTVKASVLDDKERRNESELMVWVAGGNTIVSEDRIDEENVEIIPGKKEYSVNETAEILINSPFFPAEGVMTLQRNGIIRTERFTMEKSSKVLQIPLEEKYLPNVHVKIDLVGTKQRVIYEDERDAKIPKRPAYASGEINLSISNATRNLTVTAEPLEKTLKPGGETKINVVVKDFNGNAAANTEVAVVAVDEGVLALTNYEIGNPLKAFYKNIEAGVTNYHSRENILLSYPDDIGIRYGIGRGSGSGGGSGMGDGYSSKKIYKEWLSSDVSYITTKEVEDQIKIRRNFDALAIFSPSVVTDENGKAMVDLKLPDNLTRYRITAVAVTKSKQFGKSESNITAKQSLQIRPSAPRFMNFGDTAELPVILQNQTDSPMTVNIAIRSQNANLSEGNGRKVIVPANDRVEIRFPVTTEKAGTARFQIGAVSGDIADAAEITFPVYTPATSETFATYGTTEKNGAIVQSISAPKNVFADFGGLEITTSSTQLQELTDAFIYLQNYPFECTEQISSRVLSVAALRDVLTAFDAKDLPSKQEIEAKMKTDMERLQSLQHSDGGWSFWRSDDVSIPFVAVHVAHAIARAKAKGYEIPVEMITKSLDYLKVIENNYPTYYSEESRSVISAYALYVRDLLGENDSAKAKKLLTRVGVENFSAESNGWLLSVFANDKNSVSEVETIKQNLLNRVTETAGNAHFTTNYTDGEYVLLSSEKRADGIILEALLKVQSSESGVENSTELESLIPKIVRGLLAHRVKGRWANTQENAFILLALDKYFQIYEKSTPNFTTKLWLGNSFAGEQKFIGRSTDSNLVTIPMNYLQKTAEKQNLILDKKGEGRLYYRIGLKYAPKNLKLNSADYGFAVSRTYEAIDKWDDVRQNADGSWTFKSGARVRVNVQMIAPTQRYHVALVDNLPAGIEVINPELATSGRNNYLPESELNKISYWFNHQNLRDNRAEAFTSLLREGVWNYSYLARATTPGNFVVPPAKAEEMYSPENFGRSKTDFVKVE